MRKVLITIACALGLGLTATDASALTLGLTDYYLGYVDPATPSDPDSEVFYINYLANMDPGDIDTDVNPPPNPPDQTYTFVRSSYPDGTTLPEAIGPAMLCGGPCTDQSPGALVPNVSSGFFYLFAKYGEIGHVWVLPSITEALLLQPTLPGGGLSHWSLYQVTSVSVPDGGATLGLLGLAMLGLGLLRQRMS